MMTPEAKAAAQANLDQIKPGKNYPSSVEITETIKGKPTLIRFLLQSYCVGMYCAIYFGDNPQPHQVGDYNNRKFVSGLKRDVKKALERADKIEFGPLRPVKTI